jgi:hypothetical protein
MSTLLQLFLFLNVFVIGALVMLAAQHAYQHYRGDKQKSKAPMQNGHLPPSVREHLLEEAQHNFQRILDTSATELHHDLRATAEQLNKKLGTIGNDILGKEMQHYQEELETMRAKAEAAIGGAQADIAAHQEDLKAKMTAEVEAEKQRLIGLMDTKLADAVGTFLIETLQHEVDLGAQGKYLTAMLEEHKSDFTKELTGEAAATK